VVQVRADSCPGAISLELTVHKVTHTPQQQANAALLLLYVTKKARFHDRNRA
jgi:hypothetical protein